MSIFLEVFFIKLKMREQREII